MHPAISNFFLLSVTGPPLPKDLLSNELEKSVTAKVDVVRWLRRSLESVGTERAKLTPADFERKVKSVAMMPLWMACISASSFMPTNTWVS